MDKEEVKSALKDVITNLIKDDPETARQGLHDVLAAKMRDRVNPPAEPEATDDDNGGEGGTEGGEGGDVGADPIENDGE